MLLAAPVRITLFRVTDECKVGGLRDRFPSIFRLGTFDRNLGEGRGVKKASLVPAEIRTRRLDIAKPTRYLWAILTLLP